MSGKAVSREQKCSLTTRRSGHFPGRRNVFTPCVSPVILAEVRRAYRHMEEAVEAYRTELAVLCRVAEELPEIRQVCRDPDDDHVLAAAVVIGADAIVTGDADLLSLGSFEGAAVVGVRAFLDGHGS